MCVYYVYNIISNIYTTNIFFQIYFQIGDPFSITVGVRQVCSSSPVSFNIFLEKIMQDTLKYHDSTISIGGRPISNLHFAYDINLIAGSSNELQTHYQKVLLDMEWK